MVVERGENVVGEREPLVRLLRLVQSDRLLVAATTVTGREEEARAGGGEACCFAAIVAATNVVVLTEIDGNRSSLPPETAWLPQEGGDSPKSA